VELLKLLCETPGVSGNEEPIRTVLKSVLLEITPEVSVDRLGNLIAYIPGRERSEEAAPSPPRIMIAAHMDEIGFMVKAIDEHGCVWFLPVGGFDPRTLVGQRVVIHGKHEVHGVIAPEANWLATEESKKRVRPIKELFIDVGMGAEEVSEVVHPGDAISLAQGFAELNDQVVTGRNFDDRVGVYIMVEALRRMGPCDADIYAVATAQEEVGVRGAEAAARAIEPDVGIAIDGSLAGDVPNVPKHERSCVLGAGTGIYVWDRLSMYDKRVVSFLLNCAEKNGIEHQINVGGGTDASAMQRKGTGAYVATIGPPTRYMHSTVQLCHKQDIEATIELLCAFLENVTEAFFGWEAENVNVPSD